MEERLRKFKKILVENRFPRPRGRGFLFLAQDSHASRFESRGFFARNKLDGFIVTNPVNIFYLSGFRGISQTERESILIFCPQPTLITATLYQNEAKSLAGKYLKVKIVPERNLIFAKAQDLLLKKCQRIGFEEDNLTYNEYQYFKRSLDGKLVPTSNLVENLRLIKTTEELKKIAKAQKISQKAYEQILPLLAIGQTEDEVAEKLEKVIKSLGGLGLAFESIIASGPNSGIPHHVTGRRKIKRGNMLLFDFGAKYQNYCADLSRTIFVGRATDRERNIYAHVLAAQQKAISKIKSGLRSKEAFSVAHDHFLEHKLHKHFVHGLGHGVGLGVHEAPYLRPSLNDKLQEGMVFSVEPGLYFPWGGVRIEDLVTIIGGRAKVLGHQSSQLIEIR